MADKKIPELDAAESINLTDLLLLEHGNSTDGFDSQKLVMSVFATWIASQAEFPLLLSTTAKSLIGAINEVAQSGGGGASILYGTTAPTSAQGSNGSLYVQYSHDATLDEDTVEAMFFKVNSAWTEIDLGGDGSSVFTRTLTAGETSITIASDRLSASSLIDIYTDTWGVNPTNVVADTTLATPTLTLTFEAQASDVVVKVEVR